MNDLDDREVDDFTGCLFGHLKVARPAPDHHLCHCKRWRCFCDCGNVIEAYETALLEGLTTSCGCANQLKGRRIDWQSKAA